MSDNLSNILGELSINVPEPCSEHLTNGIIQQLYKSCKKDHVPINTLVSWICESSRNEICFDQLRNKIHKIVKQGSKFQFKLDLKVEFNKCICSLPMRETVNPDSDIDISSDSTGKASPNGSTSIPENTKLSNALEYDIGRKSKHLEKLDVQIIDAKDALHEMDSKYHPRNVV